MRSSFSHFMSMFAAAVVVGTLAVAGCSAPGILGGLIPTTSTGAVDYAAITAAVNGVCGTLCSFKATQEAVTNILIAGDPTVATADAIADVLCAAVSGKTVTANLGIRIRLPRGAVRRAPNGTFSGSVTLPNGKTVTISGKLT